MAYCTEHYARFIVICWKYVCSKKKCHFFIAVAGTQTGSLTISTSTTDALTASATMHAPQSMPSCVFSLEKWGENHKFFWAARAVLG